MFPFRLITVFFISSAVFGISCGREKPTITFLNLDIRESNHQNYVEAMIATNSSVKKHTPIEIDCTVEPTGTTFIWKYDDLKSDKTFVFDSNDSNITQFITRKNFNNTGQLFRGSGVLTCSLIDIDSDEAKFEHQTQRIDIKN